ncbi:hypothetical protein ASE04_12330 [Rhizobium sp. Root708]|uniref:helix-turn-helix domain-containing protein n=1 Tax=Rhizobium sp. Root708 TaxID=1736592 RepID=UPI0006FEF39D|nr:AraC family transcriptional regulator [Rhizobium sp. Root708]KRB50713.1 hypothetical protein ASE04_12330 [Rhizobium sp. Root708]
MSAASEVGGAKTINGAFGKDLGRPIGVTEAPVLVSSLLGNSEIAVTKLICSGNPEMSDVFPYEDAWLVSTQAEDCPDHELWVDGRSCGREPLPTGTSSIYDLRRELRVRPRSSSHSYIYHLPRSMLDFITDDMGAPRIAELAHPAGSSADDATLNNLMTALRPCFEEPASFPRLFVEQITLAAAVHICVRYGRLEERSIAGSRGLAPLQMRRALELMDSRIESDVSVLEVARECSASVSHFGRAFSRTMGETPQQWLLRRRIRHACDLMRDRSLSLADIGARCGFADHAHFARTFLRITGDRPRDWRSSIRPLSAD